MPKDVFYILTPPETLSQLRPWDVLPAHLTYRLSPELRLLRLRGGQNLRGGLMVVSDCVGDLHGSPDAFCRDVEQECLSRGFRGVLLDLERDPPALEQLVRRLGGVLARRGVTLFIPEGCAPLAPGARVLISSALSGGSLSQRLAESVACFGADRVVLAVERTAEDFTLPALDGCGRPLTLQELSKLKADLNPSAFFSRELCARYFTYRSADGGVHFVLYDDLDTLCHKLEVARRAGIHRFLLPWQEICSAPEHFSIPQKSSGNFSAKN